MQTEVTFTLPYGFTDDAGQLHQTGLMRMATTLDEVAPLTDGRTQTNPAYLGIILLSRVVVQIGGFSPVPVALIERLYAADFAFLQDLYLQLNSALGQTSLANLQLIETQCPRCQTRFTLDLTPKGEP